MRLFKAIAQLIADTAACTRFFSRLNIASMNQLDNPIDVPDFQRIARAFPISGMLVCLPAAFIGVILGYTNLPAIVVAVIIVAFSATITGALHEDGLSDVFDGFFGGHTPERRLQIMKDSRIGAFGTIALICAILLRISLLASLWDLFAPAHAAIVFICVEALSRTALVWQWQKQPLARPESLAARFGKPNGKTLLQAILLSLPFLIPLFIFIPVKAMLLGVICSIASAHILGELSAQKINGVTGDVLGAIQQVSSLGLLLGVIAVI